ncbi:hypothetical protein EG856_03475 [Mycoplasmopsis phocirhinis]|uniref:Lipoprotein-associated type-17 domain-containing protein n=1 Tax=Mycoplasmopsis phocirhinis TaxID=142650 RepID=A0A4P6MPV5_9BACT|nr:hypothetical protein [Mycoplasmopsis phocirhinis]QBF34950.1 hypothetical protein EG856_03475 [Mycoplasmopsis phocirhinis]
MNKIKLSLILTTFASVATIPLAVVAYVDKKVQDKKPSTPQQPSTPQIDFNNLNSTVKISYKNKENVRFSTLPDNITSQNIVFKLPQQTSVQFISALKQNDKIIVTYKLTKQNQSSNNFIQQISNNGFKAELNAQELMNEANANVEFKQSAYNKKWSQINQLSAQDFDLSTQNDVKINFIGAKTQNNKSVVEYSLTKNGISYNYTKEFDNRLKFKKYSQNFKINEITYNNTSKTPRILVYVDILKADLTADEYLKDAPFIFGKWQRPSDDKRFIISVLGISNDIESRGKLNVFVQKITDKRLQIWIQTDTTIADFSKLFNSKRIVLISENPSFNNNEKDEISPTGFTEIEIDKSVLNNRETNLALTQKASQLDELNQVIVWRGK